MALPLILALVAGLALASLAGAQERAAAPKGGPGAALSLQAAPTRPHADFSASPTSGLAPLDVAFTDLSSGHVVARLWDFGDGSFSSRRNPSHVYALPGSYTVALIVVGFQGGDSEVKNDLITVQHQPPAAAFTATPTAGAAPLTVAFSDLSSGGLATSWVWDFGDGEGSAEQDPSHVYADPGTYSVSLMVAGPGGSDSALEVDLIEVSDPPPVAAFDGDPLTGVLPLDVQFTNQTSGGPVTSWAWDFGDGASSTDESPAHVYTSPGHYTVQLTASGPGGTDVATAVDLVEVLAPVPVITASVPPRAVTGRWVTFDVVVTDPNGDDVSLQLLNPTPGVIFQPLSNAPSPATTQVRWLVEGPQVGTAPLQSFLFRASNTTYPNDPARREFRTAIDAQLGPGHLMQQADVTGDGHLDTLARLSGNRLRVFRGGPNPPATHVAELVADYTYPFLLVDLTGDGVRDVLVQMQRSPYPSGPFSMRLYAGGSAMTGNPSPLMTFVGLDPGLSKAADITGDGIDDLIVRDEDRFQVYIGGPGLSTTPSAALRIPGSTADDRVGPLVLVDVTGDGVLDVITSHQHVLATLDGEGFVWAGGPGLTGTPAPLAVLRSPTPSPGGFLGVWSGEMNEPLVVAEVTGDAYPDIITAECGPTVGAYTAGEVLVFAGGPTLSGTPAPVATLHPPAAYSAVTPAALGLQSRGRGVLVADVSGDGQLDVIAAAPQAFNLRGAILVWKGGVGLTGTPDPDAELYDTTLVAPDELGQDQGLRSLRAADVSGDGIDDLVVSVGKWGIAMGPFLRAGACYVWHGGPGLTGVLSPTAVLRLPHPVPDDGFTERADGHAIQLRDVTGDGTLDVIASSFQADILAVQNAGVIAVWGGGPGLVGEPAATALLSIPSASPNDRLGQSSNYTGTGTPTLAHGQGVQLADVTGDGVEDVIAVARHYDEGGVNVGAVFLWAGGTSLSGTPAPTAKLRPPGGVVYGDIYGHSVLLGDITGDGQLDVLVCCRDANEGGFQTGALYVWPGGTGLVGTPPPGITLSHGVASAMLTWLRQVDIDGDGLLDIVGRGSAIGYFWRGPFGANPNPAPTRAWVF